MQSALLDTEIKGRASLEKISQQFAAADAHFHVPRRGWRRDGRQLTRTSGCTTLDAPREGQASFRRLHLTVLDAAGFVINPAKE